MKALRKNYKITFPNPISTLLILTEVEIFLLLFGNGVAMACFYAVSTGAAEAFRGNYGFNELQISLMFVCHSSQHFSLLLRGVLNMPMRDGRLDDCIR